MAEEERKHKVEEQQQARVRVSRAAAQGTALMVNNERVHMNAARVQHK